MRESTYATTIEDDPAPADRQFLHDSLTEFNRDTAGHEGYRPLACFLRDANGAVVGGIAGGTHHGWFSIDLFWLREDLRGQGRGSRMLAAAEEEAIRRGCTGAHLDTHSFQSPEFYLNHGYEVFGELPNFPKGHSRVFLVKRLRSAPDHKSTSA